MRFLRFNFLFLILGLCGVLLSACNDSASQAETPGPPPETPDVPVDEGIGVDEEEGEMDLEEEDSDAPDPEEPEPSVDDDIEDSEDSLGPPAILFFQAEEDCLIPGSATELLWEVQNATEVFLGSSALPLEGSLSVHPYRQVTYTLKALNSVGSVERELTLRMREGSVHYEQDHWNVNQGEIQSYSAAYDGTVVFLAEEEIYRRSSQGSLTHLSPSSSIIKWQGGAIDPNNSDTIYAAVAIGSEGRLYRSTDGGNSWPGIAPFELAEGDLAINQVVVSSSDEHFIYILHQKGLHRLDLLEGVFTAVHDLDGKDLRSLVFQGNTLIASDHNHLYRSTDSGQHWQSVVSDAWDEIHALRFIDGVLYLSGSQGLYQGNSDLTEWEEIGSLEGVYDVMITKEESLLPMPKANFFYGTVLPNGMVQTTYAATETGLYRSTGGDWQKVVEGEFRGFINEDFLVGITDEDIVAIERKILYDESCGYVLASPLLDFHNFLGSF